MSQCEACRLEHDRCICPFVDKFFEDNRHLMDDLSELEAREKPEAKRCLACMFFDCRCGRGLERKRAAT